MENYIIKVITYSMIIKPMVIILNLMATCAHNPTQGFVMSAEA